MDKGLTVNASGADASMRQLEIITNNLANASTVGFRADYEIMKHDAVGGDGLQTRVYSSVGGTYSEFKQGPTFATGRDLDLAIEGSGFITVQSKSGKVGLTRAGNLTVNSQGMLTTQTGELVLGNKGPIRVPESDKVNIGNDGTFSARPKGQTDFVDIDRINLVNPDVKTIHKGVDGLFYLNDDTGNIKHDLNVKITSGNLEGSNVNPVDALTKLIDLSRRFEFQTNIMKTMQENSTKSNEILNVGK